MKNKERFKNEITTIDDNGTDGVGPAADNNGADGVGGGSVPPIADEQGNEGPAEGTGGGEAPDTGTDGVGETPAPLRPQGGGDEPEKKETRGRKKGGKNAPKAKEGDSADNKGTEPAKGQQVNIFEEIGKIDSKLPPPDPAQPLAPQPASPSKIAASKVISGAMLLMVIDSTIPAFIVWVAKQTDPQRFERFKSSDIRMTKEQKKELDEAAKEVVKELLGEMSAVAAFFLGVTLVYAGNMVDAVDKYEDMPLPEKTRPLKK